MELKQIPASKITASKHLLRDPKSGDIPGLAKSMKKHQLVPVMVTKNGTGYKLVFGHRRWVAAKKNGGKVLAQVVKMTDTEKLVAAITENVAREDMTDLEKGRAIVALEKQEPDWGLEKITKIIGVSRGVALTLKQLVAEPEQIKQLMEGPDRTDATLVLVSRQVTDTNDRVALLKSAAKQELGKRDVLRRSKQLSGDISPEKKKRIINAKPGDPILVARSNRDPGGATVRRVQKGNPKVKKMLTEIRKAQDKVSLWSERIKTAPFGKEACQYVEHQIGNLIKSLTAFKVSVVIEKGKKS